MNKDTTTTPPINLIQNDSKLLNEFRTSSMTYLLIAREKGSVVEFHKSRLGKQNYCWNGEFRYWVWEKDNWRIYVSDKKGFNFEVVDSLTAKEAARAWNDFLWVVAAGSRKTKA